MDLIFSQLFYGYETPQVNIVIVVAMAIKGSQPLVELSSGVS